MKEEWPTLEGRLSNPLTTDEEAILQLESCNIPLSDWAKKKLAKIKRKVNCARVPDLFAKQ